MRTEACRPQVMSIAVPLASLFAVAVIAGLSPAFAAGCGAVSGYQHTGAHGAGAAIGVHTGPTAPSGSTGTPSISSCPSTANAAIMAHGAVAPRGASGIRAYTSGSTLVHHNIVANNQHTNALQTHNSSLGSKSAHRVKP
jgi:hypothetical protein